MKIVHLLSGGLDSVTMLYHLHGEGSQIHCLLLDYKQQHAQELTFAKTHCHRLSVPFTTWDLPALGGLNDQSWIVPNRNAIMISLAVNLAAQLDFDAVTIGCNKDDESYFPDCRERFIFTMNMAVKAAGYAIKVQAPFLELRKWQIGDMAKQMGVQSHEIWTCYRGGAKPCGECPACKKLAEALK